MMLLLLLLGGFSTALGQVLCNGALPVPVFDSVVVRGGHCDIEGLVTGSVECENGGSVILKEGAQVNGDIKATNCAIHLLFNAVAGAIDATEGSILIDAEATANTVKCSGNVDVKIYGCLTSLLVEQPNDANITVDCLWCRCDSTPAVEVKGPGTCGEVIMKNCEVAEGATAQDVLINEVTITGGVTI